jgi:hypothetical protein
MQCLQEEDDKRAEIDLTLVTDSRALVARAVSRLATSLAHRHAAFDRWTLLPHRGVVWHCGHSRRLLTPWSPVNFVMWLQGVVGRAHEAVGLKTEKAISWEQSSRRLQCPFDLFPARFIFLFIYLQIYYICIRILAGLQGMPGIPCRSATVSYTLLALCY